MKGTINKEITLYLLELKSSIIVKYSTTGTHLNIKTPQCSEIVLLLYVIYIYLVVH